MASWNPYVEAPDIPAGMSIPQYRSMRAAQGRGKRVSMLRSIFAIVGCALALTLALASAASASPCARATDGQCMPNLGDLTLSVEGRSAYVRALVPGSVATMGRAYTDLHAYSARGRALVQRYSARARAYTFHAPGSGRVLAAWSVENRDWYAYGRVIVVGWQS